jgi:hypothetical protein
MADQAPIIGSFRNPEAKSGVVESPDPAIVERKKTEATPTKSMSEGIQEDLQQGVDETKAQAKKAQSYEEILAEASIQVSEAHSIVDDLLTNGFYEETLQVTKNVSVTFRTRSHKDFLRYTRALEILNPRFVEEQQEISIRYFLAASLAGFKGEKFKHPTALPNNENEKEVEDAFSERLDWVERQSERIINLLAQKLHVFDTKIATVTREGVIENF